MSLPAIRCPSCGMVHQAHHEAPAASFAPVPSGSLGQLYTQPPPKQFNPVWILAFVAAAGLAFEVHRWSVERADRKEQEHGGRDM